MPPQMAKSFYGIVDLMKSDPDKAENTIEAYPNANGGILAKGGIQQPRGGALRRRAAGLLRTHDARDCGGPGQARAGVRLRLF